MSSASRTVGASAGSARRARRRQQPLDVEPEPPAEREQPVELLGLVAVARDDQRAGARAGRDRARTPSASSAQNAGNAGRGAQAELEQRVLAELRLGDRREHARGDVPGARLARVEHADAQPALRGAPCAREADRPAADDGDVRLGMLHGHC